jgi:cytochrome c2
VKRLYRWGVAALLGVVAMRGEPLVVGYDRFHAAQPSADGGRLLYNELGCANCHGGETGLPPRRGPDLTTVTTRSRSEWLAAYIAEPERERAGTSMPHLFAGRDAADVEAAVHYLGTLAPKSSGRSRLIRHINARRGQDLFHTLGCVACHAPKEDQLPPRDRPTPDEFSHRNIAFPSLKEKYVLGSLAEFLRDPLKARPDGRMPRIEMEDQDALDIASYLLEIPGSYGEEAPKLAPFVPDQRRAEHGRRVMTELRCAACHELPTATAVAAIPLRRAGGGCLADVPAAGVPRYSLGAGQRQALRAYLVARDQPLEVRQQANLSLEALNCAACHERDGRGGPDAARKTYFFGDHNLGDTGHYPPPLTDIGRKLQPEWLEKTLTGVTRVRPYLQTRMPIYGAATASLSKLLAHADAHPEMTLPAGDIEAGRKLLGTEGGVGCITCHSWNDRASLGIHALDISNMSARLQPGWLRDYLVNPGAYRPGTLMPSFWPEGKASNHLILEGDTGRQIASILEFSRSGQGLPMGFPSTIAREFELTPKDRPIVLRTFMQDVGTHAILAGFPEGVHLAYDGDEGRPALAWKERFFDAYGTWFVRFAPFEKPLGESVVKWPPAALPSGERRFNGYRLDAAGVPTFLLTIDGVSVEDRFEAIANGFRRSVRWNVEMLRMLPVSHPDGVTVTEAPGSTPGKLNFIYTW